MKAIPDRYEPQSVEAKWYQFWLDQRLFHADPDPDKKPYTIVIPPPNITGVLHMGHILNNTLQDILIRRKKMEGYNTEWVPGTDHAAIATQNVLEKMLKKDGKTKEDLGREKFEELFWDWKAQSGGTIIKQLKYLGAACDWDREAFTMDENLTRAVQEVFIRLYDKGLVYRGKYIINWCPRCLTALSDDETEHEEHQSHLWYLRYPLTLHPEQYVVVATTRPETMLGDTAVAVNPKDERFSHLIGQTVTLPLVERPIPIIADDFVDPLFGTGCVKVTPAHDPNDFQMGLRHRLPKVIVMNSDGTMNEEAGAYAGMDRQACRKKIVEDLQAKGLLEKIENHQHQVGHCYRCHTVIEPALSDQWFVKMEPLAKPVIAAIESDDVRFYPDRWKKVALNWLTNIRDWCISRQIWLGHKIPIWYCPEGHVTASIGRPDHCPVCASRELHQDPDVLDTWFSSWLWPFSTLGWPKQTADLSYFYPTDTLVTDPGILFFWVIRMMMAGYEFMGAKPFSEVHLHGVVCDEQGRKMSKSLGNSPDPLDIIQNYSADAMRFAIIFSTPPGQNTLYSDKQTELGRNFTNKIWNVFRLLAMNLEDYQVPAGYSPESATLADQWMLHELNAGAREIEKCLNEYRFNEAEHAIYDLFWKQFCDWYIEIAKLRWSDGADPGDARRAKGLVLHVFQRLLKLLHPFMPFITEEIRQQLKENQWLTEDRDALSILDSPAPRYDAAMENPEAAKNMQFLMEVITQIRNLRAEKGIKPKDNVPIMLSKDPALIRENEEIVRKLAKVESIAYNRECPAEAAIAVVADLEIYLPLTGLVDLEAEKARLSKEIEQLDKYMTGLNHKLQNEKFLANAPAQVVETERARYQELLTKLNTLRESLRKIS